LIISLFSTFTFRQVFIDIFDGLQLPILRKLTLPGELVGELEVAHVVYGGADSFTLQSASGRILGGKPRSKVGVRIAESSLAVVHEVIVNDQVPYSLPSPVMRPKSLPGTESASALVPVRMYVVI
jgi:hypothetical protein